MTALDDALWPRAALPRRPMLGAVLDALTVTGPGDPLPSFWCATGLPTTTVDRGNVIVVGSPYHSVRYPWIDASVTEAYELLQARGLIPTDYRPRFVCDACGGGGVVACGLARLPCLRCALPCAECGGSGRVGEVVCGCVGSLREDAVALGHRPHPPTVAALASWASLGFAAGDDGAPGILGAEELAAATSPDAPVCWRVAQPGADASRAYASGSPARRLLDAGFGWRRRASHTTLYVPPLGLVTP